MVAEPTQGGPKSGRIRILEFLHNRRRTSLAAKRKTRSLIFATGGNFEDAARERLVHLDFVEHDRVELATVFIVFDSLWIFDTTDNLLSKIDAFDAVFADHCYEVIFDRRKIPDRLGAIRISVAQFMDTLTPVRQGAVMVNLFAIFEIRPIEVKELLGRVTNPL